MLHIFRERQEARKKTNDLAQEASVGLDLAAFIGTANLFFTGLIILNLQNLPSIVELPTVYLVISAVSFIVSAIIAANVTGTADNSKVKLRMTQVFTWISEYPGFYLFLIAIPLVILGVTSSLLVQLTTAIACYGGLILYSTSPYSIDHRRFRGGWDRILYTSLLVAFCVGVYSTALFAQHYLLPVGIVGIVVLLGLSYFTINTNSNIDR